MINYIITPTNTAKFKLRIYSTREQKFYKQFTLSSYLECLEAVQQLQLHISNMDKVRFNNLIYLNQRSA